MVLPKWLSIALRQDAYLFQYGIRRKIFEAQMARKGYTMLDILEDWAKVQPNEKCIIQDDNILTYQGMRLI